MSLTTLLVLIALYSDSVTSLPRTSYLKALDIWFMFSIAFLTAIIAAHLVTNRVNTKMADSVALVEPWVGRSQDKGCQTRMTNAKVLKVTQILLAVVYFSFQVWYWIYVALI